ncbi:MFS transporter [Fusibacter sp. 3D3]|uniref:MFS transporter n=1 Tax=Fusibacter sp. 3D3 TaxID=1048380 RepID=UPI000853708F|nr:MFS transporter [Fusibacter sp. 3D3]GAU78850.1 probable 3-phenylpropionic acid transporter [Fusibacter sp. 3D3]
MYRLSFATTKYSIIQALYWSTYCMMLSFSAVYLLARQYNNSEIGAVLALINILALFLQPAMAAYIDKTKKIGLKQFIAILLVSVTSLSLLIVFTAGSKYTVALFMILSFGILASIQPLINSICFEYEKLGIRINFGVARGFGSGAYAVTSIILGTVVKKMGADWLPIYYSLSTLLLLAMVLKFSPRKQGLSAMADVSNEFKIETSAISSINVSMSMSAFLKKYKRFTVFVLGTSLVFVPHILINSFMIQIITSIGGTSSEMGTATFLAAITEIPIMFAFSRLMKKVSCGTLLKISAVIFTIKHLMTYLAPSIPIFYMTQLLQIGAFGLYAPASVYYVNHIINKDDLVKGQAMVTNALTLGSILASIIGGVLLDYVDPKSVLLFGGIVSIVGSTLMILSVETQGQVVQILE